MLPVARNSFAERINPQPPAADSLSALAALLRVRDVEVQDLCRFASAWRSEHEAEGPHWAQFHIVIKGECFLQVQSGQTFRMRAGGLLLLPRGDAHVVRSARASGRTTPVRVEYNDAVRIKTNTGESSDTELICGRLRFDAVPSGLIAAMPAAIALDVNSAQALDHMRNLIKTIEQELSSPRAGARAVAADLSRALFVMMLREHFERAEASGTALSLLFSPVCATVVNAIVRDPSRDWTLDALADKGHVSRATLVRAFQKAAGMAPLAFIAEVRLNLARQSLATTRGPLSHICAAVGYTSESAFARAFKRRFGISPAKLRPR
jgi:AraC family transcriptional regulator, activator of mtrCDE